MFKVKYTFTLPYLHLLLSGAAQTTSTWRSAKKYDEMLATWIQASFISNCIDVQRRFKCWRHIRESRTRFRGFILLYFMVSRHTSNASHHIYIMTAVAGLTGSDLNWLFFWAAGDLIKGTLNGEILKTPSLLTGTIQKGLLSITGNVNESPLQRSWSGKKPTVITVYSPAIDSTPHLINKTD